LAKKTRKSYRSHWKSYEQFCARFDYPTYPTSDVILSQYIAYMNGQRKKSGDTIRCYVSGGIRDKLSSMPDNESGWVELQHPSARSLRKRTLGALAAACKVENMSDEARAAQLKRGPVVPAKLPAFKDALFERYGVSDPVLAKAMWLLVTMLMNSGCRPGELVASSGIGAKERHEGAQWANIRPSGKARLPGPASEWGSIALASFWLTLPHTKNSQNKEVVIAFAHQPCFGIDPVDALISYLAELSSPAYCSEYGRAMSTGYLFKMQDRRRVLTYDRARLILKEVGAAAGWDPSECFLHSFRIGLATCGAAAGLSMEQLKKLGRWKCESSVERYVRDFTSIRNELVQKAFEAGASSLLARAALMLNHGGVADEVNAESDSEDERSAVEERECNKLDKEDEEALLIAAQAADKS
jgi:hypothetical protein